MITCPELCCSKNIRFENWPQKSNQESAQKCAPQLGLWGNPSCRLNTVTSAQDLDRSPFANVCVANVSQHMQTFTYRCDSKSKFHFLVTNRKNPQHVLTNWIFALILQQRAHNLVKDSITFTGTFSQNSVDLPVAQRPTHLCRATARFLPFGIY